MQVTATIVTYNNDTDVLFKAIKSFLDTNLLVKIYIVDNSNQIYLKDLCSQFNQDKLEYIPIEKNRGFGAGHNVILRNQEKLGKYHIVLNPDVRFNMGTIETIYNYMEQNTDVGNLMPKILYPDGSLQYLCKLLPTPFDWIFRLLIPFKRFKNALSYRFEMRFTNYDEIIEVPYLSGCFMFLRKETIAKIGIFDENIFMYGEDTDLNRRIAKLYKTVFFPNVFIIHNFEKGSHKKFKLLIIHIRAAIYYFNKWGWFFDKNRSLINSNTVNKYLN